MSWATVLAAVASSLGILGFVVFVGGALLWARFSQMAIPAEHAVALVPKAELVATGAQFLAPAVLLAAFVTLVMVVIRTGLKLPQSRIRGLRWSAETLKVPVVASRDARAVVLGLLILTAELVIAVVALATIPAAIFALLLGTAVLSTLAIGRVFRKDNLAWSTLATFLMLGTFWLGVGYAKTSYALKVIPMAYSRAQTGAAVIVERGYFVAETSDRIYFASTPDNRAGPNELREVPRSETDDLEVGDLTPAKQAPARAAQFALNLCRRLDALVPLHPGKQPSPACTPMYLALLAEQAKTG